MRQIIDDDAFDVIVVSPRNHFLFTPMLPSSAVGTVRARGSAQAEKKKGLQHSRFGTAVFYF